MRDNKDKQETKAISEPLYLNPFSVKKIYIFIYNVKNSGLGPSTEKHILYVIE